LTHSSFGRRATMTLGLLACLPGGFATGARAQGLAASPRAFRLPADMSAVVLRWDSLGGMAPGPDEPALLVHSGGVFTARPLQPGAARRRGRLDGAGLQALLRELVDGLGFAAISADDIQAQIAAISQRTGRNVQVVDGGETRIALTMPNLSHSVTFAALHVFAPLFPEIDALRRLRAVQLRLLALAETAR